MPAPANDPGVAAGGPIVSSSFVARNAGDIEIAAAAQQPNLTITSARLVTSTDQAITYIANGEMVFVEAQWVTSNLTSANTYITRFTMDGVSINTGTITGQSGTNLGYLFYAGGWLAATGTHTVTVTVDAANNITESNEADNSKTFSFTTAAPTTLQQKFITPLGGVPFQDWTIVNYVDANPLTPGFSDFRGGPFTYDGHQGMDIALPNFAHMDSGVPIVAAAAGVVTAVQDGNFDRQTGMGNALANYVTVDIGGGWQTIYYHCSVNTIAVKVGDTVAQGQLLALVGSSGDSTDAHLHFEVHHNGDVVETNDDPANYWVNPLPYQGDYSTRVLDSGITNYNPFPDFKERPTDVGTFPTSTGWTVWFWQRFGSAPVGSSALVDWYRPDGTLSTQSTISFNSGDKYGEFVRQLPSSIWSAYPGAWQATLVVNGAVLAQQSFTVTNDVGDATAKVAQGSTNIINRRTTAIDFGSAASGAAPSLVFSLQNIGSSTLNAGNLLLPPGFSLVGSFPTGIPAGGSANFTIQMDTSQVGTKFGQLTFITNDPNAPTYAFNIGGTITGTPVAGALRAYAPRPGIGDLDRRAPRVLDSSATLTDLDSSNYNTGRLTVTPAGNATIDDRLSILNLARERD